MYIGCMWDTDRNFKKFSTTSSPHKNEKDMNDIRKTECKKKKQNTGANSMYVCVCVYMCVCVMKRRVIKK